jgi:hypothetical protein
MSILNIPDLSSVSLKSARDILYPRLNDKLTAANELSADTEQISPSARLLADSGIDLSSSVISFQKEGINFNLQFLQSKTELIKADGFYSEERQSLSISFQYAFERTEMVDGQMKLRKFQVDFGFSMSDIKKESLTGSVKKEDIMDYVKRVVKRIFEVADDEDISIGKVLFEKEDLEDILGMEDKKLRESIINLLNTAILVAKLKEQYNDKHDSKVVDFGVEREKILEILKKKETEQTRESWLNITEISGEMEKEKDPEITASPEKQDSNSIAEKTTAEQS